MESRLSDKFQKYLMLDDICDYHPGYDPYMFAARSLRKEESLTQLQGTLEEMVSIKAFMIPVEQRELIWGKVSHEKRTE